MITVSATGLDQAISRVKGVGERARDLSVPLTRAGIIVRDSAVLRFRTAGGDQAWAPLSAATIKRKGSSRIGIDSGRLWQSIAISQSDRTSVTIGTNVYYARFFQFGTRRQPARRFLLVSRADLAKIRQAFARYLSGRDRGAIRGVQVGA